MLVRVLNAKNDRSWKEGLNYLFNIPHRNKNEPVSTVGCSDMKLKCQRRTN